MGKNPKTFPRQFVLNVSLPPFRTLTELLKQPGEAGAVDGAGIHHPIGTNGISARTMRTNNGRVGVFVFCIYGQ